MSGLLAELPAPPEGKTGWPWTEEAPTDLSIRDWPRITIVTPSYNQGHYIEETIRSILLQNYPNLEYIVMDGGSTDDTVPILEKYDRWISHWVSEKDRGQSHAINKGFAPCTGRVRAYLNSDDLYMPGALFAAADKLGGGDPALSHGICVMIDEAGARLRTHSADIHSFEEVVDLWGVWWNRRQFVQPEVFWNAAAHEAAGEFREDLNFAMDFEFWCRVLREGCDVHTIESEVSSFRITPDQKSSQSEAVADELRRVVQALLWDNDSPIPRRKRVALQRMWLYDARFLKKASGSAALGEGRPRRWVRLAWVLARNPGILRTEAFWRRARQLGPQ